MLVLLLALVMNLGWSSDPLPYKGMERGPNYICTYSDTELNCWGDNLYNQAINLKGFSHIKKVKLDRTFGCLIDDEGLVCWGEVPFTLPPELIHSKEISDFTMDSTDLCVLINQKIHCIGPNAKLFHGKENVSALSISDEVGCFIQNLKVVCLGNRTGYGLLDVPNYFGDVVHLGLAYDKACLTNSLSEIICWGRDGYYRKILPFKPKSLYVLSTDACVVGAEGQHHCVKNQVSLPSSFGPVAYISHGRFDSSFCAINVSQEIFCDSRGLAILPPLVKTPRLISANRESTYFIDQEGVLFSSGRYREERIKTLNASELSSFGDFTCYVDEKGGHCLSTDAQQRIIFPDHMDQFISLTPGDHNICGVLKSGKISCFTSESPIFDYPAALPPEGLTGVKKLVAGYDHFCSLNDKNKIDCWSDKEEVTPEFDPKTKILSLSGAYDYTCALDENQLITCWGRGDMVKLPPPSYTSEMKHIISGHDFSCVYGDHEIYCWGKDRQGILYPPTVIGKIKLAVAGHDHACFIDDQGVKCWGNNQQGQYQFRQELGAK